MTEEYISGYLNAISTLKDILTPNLGGTNHFFSIPKDRGKNLLSNIQDFIISHRSWYDKHKSQEPIESRVGKIELVKIENWTENFEALISDWTCDKILVEVNGKNGYNLSTYLIKFLLIDFFRNDIVSLYKMLPDWEYWHWGDMMSEEYIFETESNIYIMHFGESS